MTKVDERKPGIRPSTAFSWLLPLSALLGGSAPAVAQPVQMMPGVHAELRPRSYQVSLGRPVWVKFSLENTGDEPITLTVPGIRPAIPTPQAGLPLAHIFGGSGSGAVVVTLESGRRWDHPQSYRTPTEAPIVLIAPFSSVGIAVDLREHYPSLRGAGQYRITWKPYGGAIETVSTIVKIAPLKQAEILTDAGTMTLQFFYTDAPKHISSFLELAEDGFYDGKTFHRIEPGYLIQGGCPRGDGSGIRPDGTRLMAEFNTHPMQKGTVAMALLDDDPDSASCQFFICNTRQKAWDGKYTVFGELVGEESFATLDKLMRSTIDDLGRPVSPIIMRTIRIIDAPHSLTPTP